MKPFLAICVLLLTACTTTPEGKRATAEASAIGANNATAKKATLDAKDSNAQITSLDQRIDNKDWVLEHAKIVP